MSFEIHLGDCLELIQELPDASVDLVLTDPPYGINTKSDGDGKLNPWADLTNSAYWYTAWIRECRRVLKPTGALWSFLNWRSLVTFQKAACDARWSIESLMVWDKQWIGPGGHKGLRPAYELVALWAMPEFTIPDRGTADIQRFKWSGHKPTGHPAEKPVALLEFLIEKSSQPGAVVLDLFSGSGSTGVAAMNTGRRFVGFEQDARWHSFAQQRVLDAVLGDLA